MVDLRPVAGQFTARFIGKKLTMTCSYDVNFRAVQKKLQAKSIDIPHTFAIKEELEIKVILRGLHPNTDPEIIKEVLVSKDFPPA